MIFDLSEINILLIDVLQMIDRIDVRLKRVNMYYMSQNERTNIISHDTETRLDDHLAFWLSCQFWMRYNVQCTRVRARLWSEYL